MQFNIRLFSRLVHRAMEDMDSKYTEEEVMSVFACYFETYERYIGRIHPNIRMEQIKRIIAAMPELEDCKHSSGTCIDAEEYPLLISQHFETYYRGCDYNINHFFSGAIREMRFYETCV